MVVVKYTGKRYDVYMTQPGARDEKGVREVVAIHPA
jgi:hypothetical protein